MTVAELTDVRLTPLGEVADFIRGITFTPEDKVEPRSPGSVVCMRTANVQEDLDQSDLIAIPKKFVRREEQYLREGDVLVSTANSWNLVGKCSWVPELKYTATAGGFISILRAHKQKVDERYLYYWFASDAVQHEARLCGRQTTNISNLNFDRCLALTIPLPFPDDRRRSLAEQKRIAAILDKADAFRRKRREAADMARSLRRSVFLEMFGDPHINRNAWPVKPFAELWKDDLRNGISPSSTGSFVGKVLVLSAITGDRFNESAVKTSMFTEPFSGDQLVQRDELLICRGNGNKSLVGIGRFPVQSYADVVFPDTMIAARIDSEKADHEFIEEIWNGDFIRGQIEQVARTTNGTYKVNQQMLAGVSLPVPPIGLQREFGRRVVRIRSLSARFGDAAGEELFNSLVQRAFRGEL